MNFKQKAAQWQHPPFDIATQNKSPSCMQTSQNWKMRFTKIWNLELEEFEASWELALTVSTNTP